MTETRRLNHSHERIRNFPSLSNPFDFLPEKNSLFVLRKELENILPILTSDVSCAVEEKAGQQKGGGEKLTTRK